MLKELFASKWLNVYDRDGWLFASRNKFDEIASPGRSKANAVVVVGIKIPRRRSDGRKKLLVISQVRKPIGEAIYELPAGLIDDGETFEQAGRREVKEETGMEIVEITSVSENIFSSAGMTDESVSVIFANVEGSPTKEHQESSEDIEIHLMDKQDLLNLKNSGAPMGARLAMTVEFLIRIEQEKW